MIERHIYQCPLCSRFWFAAPYAGEYYIPKGDWADPYRNVCPSCLKEAEP